MPQACFPFVMEDEEQTLDEMMLEGKYLLGPRLEENSTEKTRCVRLHRVSYTPLAETTMPTSQGNPGSEPLRTATTLPQEGRGSRHPEEAVLFTSDSPHAGWCRCPHGQAHHAVSSLRAPVSPPNRASPISLFCRDPHGFPHTVSLADGSQALALWSGQRSWRQAAAANSTRADLSLPRSSILSLS